MNSLVVVRSKFNTDINHVNSFIQKLAAGFVNFDKIAYIAYDSASLISSQLKECCSSFENTVVLCHLEQQNTLVDFLSKQYGGQFDTAGVMHVGDKTAIIGAIENLRDEFAMLVFKVFEGKYTVRYDRLFLRLFGAPDEALDNTVRQAQACGGDMRVTVNKSYGDVRIEIAYSSNTPKMISDKVMRIFVSNLGEYIYALDDTGLAEQLYNLLKLRRMRLSVAESFTGGGVGKKLVDVPGISEVYSEGLNTYSNEAKMLRLGVQQMTLKQHGAVSGETAYEMAKGLLDTGLCDVAISTTGIAGPKSDMTSKPVGLAFIAIGVQNDIAVYKFNYRGDRATITQTAINNALFLAYKTLK